MNRITVSAGASLLFLCAIMAGCDRPVVPAIQPDAGPADTGPAAARFALIEATVAPTAVTTCNLERLDATPFANAPATIKGGSDFVAAGFLYSEASNSVPAKIRLRAISADGQQAWDAPIEGRLDRPDVPSYFNIGAWAQRSGFEQLLSSSGLDVGDYRLVVTFDDDGKQFACDNGRQLIIQP